MQRAHRTTGHGAECRRPCADGGRTPLTMAALHLRAGRPARSGVAPSQRRAPPPTLPHTPLPARLSVRCTAVEQDMEVASTSGRPHGAHRLRSLFNNGADSGGGGGSSRRNGARGGLGEGEAVDVHSLLHGARAAETAAAAAAAAAVAPDGLDAAAGAGAAAGSSRNGGRSSNSSNGSGNGTPAAAAASPSGAPPELTPQRVLNRKLKAAGTLPLLLELIGREGDAFSPVNTTHALQRLAKLHGAVHGATLAAAAAEAAAASSSNGGGAGNANGGGPAAAREAALRNFVAPALDRLRGLVLRQVDHFDTFALSAALWSYGNLGHSDEAVVGALCRRGLAVVEDFAPIDCASALVGLAKLRVRPARQREFVDVLLQHSLETLAGGGGGGARGSGGYDGDGGGGGFLDGDVTGDEDGGAGAAASSTNHNNHNSYQFSAGGSVAATIDDEWSAQEVASVAWALGRLGAGGQHRRMLLEALMDAVVWRLPDFSLQELTIVVYGYARARYRLPRQLIAISHAVASHLPLLKPQDAANLLWAFARLDFKPPPPLLDRLPGAIIPRLPEFKPQELANLLYGYGQLRHHHGRLMDAAAGAAAPRLAQFSTQDLVLTVWSYGAVKHGPTPASTALLVAAAAELHARLPTLLPLQMAVVAKAFAKAGHQPPPAFMAALAAAARATLPDFKPVELCHLLWGYAQLGYRDVALFEAVAAQAVTLLQTWARPLPKLTVDTLVYCCSRVGYWPQALVDTAEMRGVYVKQWRGCADGDDVECDVTSTEAAAAQQVAARAPASWRGGGGGGAGGDERTAFAERAASGAVATSAADDGAAPVRARGAPLPGGHNSSSASTHSSAGGRTPSQQQQQQQQQQHQYHQPPPQRPPSPAPPSIDGGGAAAGGSSDAAFAALEGRLGDLAPPPPSAPGLGPRAPRTPRW